ncbi:hypothetical protein [Allomuricauda sp. SCSIO 65647]|uniref:hypothetical protein n=1 Tax=Allomuricauda sp. SCSIO 65647 TaxID=2908843 RepID=UPI001F4458AD|nr:hypothetical protein [Muricauda sp. SCSIO 65647]UJH68809.1 hypothetical protein L0P89_06220 [Muricauda sp. SCSIO 65647]
MKKLLFGLILMSLVSCNSRNTNFNELKNCLNEEDISVLEKGLMDFESRLAEKYEGLDKEEGYIQFLNDFIGNEISPDFFLNPKSKTIRTEVKEIGIWQLSEESDEGMEAEIRLDGSQPEKSAGILTLRNEFQNCLITKVSNDGIKNFLYLRTKVPNLSWGFTTKYIHDGINEKDLKNKMNRLAMAYGIYYEFALNLEK